MSKGSHRAAPFDATEAEARRREREEMRELIRELHEAAKDARTARRELREAVREVNKLIKDDIGTLVDRAQAELQEWVDANVGQLDGAIQTYFESVRTEVRQHFAEALAIRTPDDIIRIVLDEAAASILAQVRDTRAAAQRGGVLVATPETAGLATQISDVVIDMRD